MKTSLFQKKLLNWYRVHQRVLPWRLTKDPYKILVSEIMLQQTQVDTVIPYYERWVARFPDFETLANAKESEVLKFWQGLGYYRRAKMLHRNAQEVHTRFQGKLPQSPKELIQLPGIGRYTAGAVASIAFNKKAPLVDGNVIRILTRLFAISENIADKKTVDFLWELAEKILPEKSVGDFNQALMELGATICFPRVPQCGNCPVSSLCQAHALQKALSFPVKSPNVKITKLKEFAFVLRDKQNRLLVRKQKTGERWDGLWTLPHFKNLKAGLLEFGLKNSALKKLRADQHGFTRYQITLNTFIAQTPYRKNSIQAAYEWMSRREIKKVAFPTVYQKILNEVFEP